MKHAKIISDESFDWEQARRAMENVQREDGSVNWRAAAGADPGATKCPECETYFWAEAELLQCTECGTTWNTKTKEIVGGNESTY